MSLDEPVDTGSGWKRWANEKLRRIKLTPKFLFPTIVLIMVVVVVRFFAATRFLDELLLNSAIEESVGDSDQIRTLIDEEMMRAEPLRLSEFVAHVARERGLSWVGVLDAQGYVRVTTRPELVGRQFEVTDAECRPCHTVGRATRKGSVSTLLPEVDVLRTVTPLENSARCQSCHDPGKAIVGMLIVDRDLGSLRAMQWQFRRGFATGSLFVLGAIVGSLWILIEYLVLKRVRTLCARVRAVAQDVSSASAVRAGDELTSLENEFQSMSDRLAQQSKVILLREKERADLLGRVISTQEEERARISRELHDGLAQTLSASLLEVRSVVPEEFRPKLEEGIAQAIEEVRTLAWDLRPSILSDFGLMSALRRLVDEASNRGSCRFDLEFRLDEGTAERMDPAIEVALYRIAQESIRNVERHAAANQATIVVERHRDSIRMSVDDDGCGFDDEQRHQGRLGIIGIRERVALLGGEFVIRSFPGQGTQVRVDIPLRG